MINLVLLVLLVLQPDYLVKIVDVQMDTMTMEPMTLVINVQTFVPLVLMEFLATLVDSLNPLENLTTYVDVLKKTILITEQQTNVNHVAEPVKLVIITELV